jgi:hypothetical protein
MISSIARQLGGRKRVVGLTPLLVMLGALLVARAGWADAPPDEVAALSRQLQELTESVRQLASTVQSQQERMAELERANAQLRQAQGPPPAAAGPSVVAVPGTERGMAFTGPLGGPPRVPSVPSSLSAFNPEIGVLVDVVGEVSETSTDAEGHDKISAREMELVIGHPIDPYSRMGITATFSDFEEASLEEAYITHWGLPEVRVRAGRFRPKIGKASAIHRDSLDTVDEPRVVEQYLGAEGLSRSGVDASWFVPAPWTAVTHELTGGVLEGGVGEGGTMFGTARRRPTYYAHLKNFWDIADMSNAELGLSYLLGSSDDDAEYEVSTVGLDATLTYFLTPTNKVKWQSELYVQDRDEFFSVADDGTPSHVDDRPWGAYSLVDVRLSPRLGVGGRFDYVEPVGVELARKTQEGDVGLSGFLTLYQSEFARWRLQYRHTNFAQGGNDDTVFLQGTFVIGVHKHQLQ